jgi:hypothetical protein
MSAAGTMSSSPANASPMTEREWDKLIGQVLQRLVVPVVGPELLTVQEGGEEQSLYAVWARELAGDSGIVVPGNTDSALYDVANELSATRNRNPLDLAYDVDDVIRNPPRPIPDALKKLAEISSFSLYVTTTIDHLLEEALKQARGRNQFVGDIVFTTSGTESRKDLSKDFGPTSSPMLYHLFGSSSRVPDTFAKTDDDLIEYSWALLDQEHRPNVLYDYLQKKTVLLLGCSFPDWLGRFLVRALYRDKAADTINIYYVSPRCEPGLAEFLKRRWAKVITTVSAAEFVDKLHQKWCEKGADTDEANTPPADTQPAFKPGAVFLSYASEDRDAARRVRTQLEAANIDTWMDEQRLQSGDQYEQKIRENIADAAFFVAIISRSFELPSRVRGGYVLKEWKWAEDAALSRHKDDAFLQPLVIDDTPKGADFIDQPYRSLHWAEVRDGRLPPDFIDCLSRGIRKYRRAR